MVTSAAIKKSAIDLCLLGPLNVTVDGEPVPIGGPRQMAVLARLMLSPDQVVTMDQLVDSVWDGDEPNQPHVAIRSYVSNLRRAIEPNRRRRATDSCLASSPPGYRLVIDPASVDWVRFQRQVDDGRYQLSTGHYGEAVTELRGALSLWRGDPCSGLPDSDVFLAHRARLTEVRETAVELLFEALLLLGDHASVAAEVEAAIAENPLRERLTELGMLALYRAGRQSEALALGQGLRARLVDELGIDPSPSIDEMELKILNHDRSLDPPAEVAAPRSTRSKVVDPVIDITDRAPPALGAGRGSPVEPAHLGPTGFDRALDPLAVASASGALGPIGRSAELEALTSMGAALAAGRSATAVVTGEQGIGKTTLVRAAAARLADDVTVVWARSVPDGAAPLWPWAQAVVSILEPGTGPEQRSLADGLSPLLALGSSVADVVGLAEPPAGLDQTEVMLAVTRLLERRSRRAPLVLVFEDLQWADPATVSLINYAASSLIDMPVGFVLTWRETDLGAGPVAAGLRKLARLPTLIRVELGGLDDAAIRELAEALGRPLSPGEPERIERRCGGNPLYIREILSHADSSIDGGHRWSTLKDAVVDRVDRLHPSAMAVLSAASLYRIPFTHGDLLPLCDLEPDHVQQVLDAAVRGGVLEEADPTEGTYLFHHELVGEVLASELLAVTRSGMHRAIGHHLVAAGAAGYEAAHHLSRSPDAEDRALAGAVALETFHRLAAPGRLPELDEYVRIGLAAADHIADHSPAGHSPAGHPPAGQSRTGRPLTGPTLEGFAIDALCYLSWRAWVDGRPADWLDNARRSLQAALDAVDPSTAGRASSRQKGSSRPATRGSGTGQRCEDESLDRLARCAMNVIGWPPSPIGPTSTGELVTLPGGLVDLLATAAERLPTDHVARWVVQVHLAAIAGPGEPSGAARTKALRDGRKVVSAARRRLSSEDLALVLRAFAARYADSLEPRARLSTLIESSELRPGPDAELFLARWAYPALAELGRIHEAEQQVEAAMAATIGGDPFLVAESRVLAIRHLLWTGRLESAASELAVAAADWAVTGLVEPLPLTRQRCVLELLQHPGGPYRPDDDHVPWLDERVGPAESALRSLKLGDLDRAGQSLDRALEDTGTGRSSPPDLAMLVAAAAMLGHRAAAEAGLELLTPAGDRLIAWGDGSVILGPASLYAGLAATTAGQVDRAGPLLERAARAVTHCGGSTALVDVVSGLDRADGSNRAPTIP